MDKAEYPVGRFPIVKTWPVVDGGKFPVKAFEGEVLDFGATAFREGHDKLAVELVLTSPGGKTTRHPMLPGQPGLDQWVTRLQLTEVGSYSYQVSAWDDEYGSWVHATSVKLAAQVDQELMILEGKKLLERMSEGKAKTIAAKFEAALKILDDKKLSPGAKFEKVMASGLSELAAKHPLRERETLSGSVRILCERKLAGSGSWYEFFPRSEGAKQNRDGSWVSGTFKSATKSLQRVSDMGFDVLYLPPIHPIGTTHRKGKNNTLVAEKGDPGSPWAIGAKEGGHDA
ncbi:MAG: maltotransferase domain-containing protein, partial [Aquiluna sp.]